jgi:P-type Cu2+ transporter
MQTAARATPLRCDHCLADLAEQDAVRAEVAGAAHVFCCAGCRGVFQLVHDEGLAAYYDTRRWTETGPAQAQALDLAAFREGLREEGGAAELDVAIDGIRCASCVWLNEKLLQRTPGVLSARVNYATHRARVRFDPALVGLERVLSRIQAAGYLPKPWSDTEQAQARRAEARDLLVRLGTACFLASQLMIYQAALYAGYFQGQDAGTRRLMEWISLGLTLPVFLYSGAPFLSATARGLRHLRFNMDALVVIGSGSALLYSVYAMLRGGEVYFDTAAMIPTLVLAGRFVEATAKGRASEAVARLARLAPREARLVARGPDGALARRLVPVGEVRPGDRVEIVPGERIPLDGAVVEGASEVDESLVTGESRPVSKAPGAAVIGGTVNQHGALLVEVTRVGKDTVLAGIVRAVEDAQAQKPRIQAVADRVVGWFVPGMLALAVGTTLFWLARGAPGERALMIGISVVVIACPCALGLATPIAVLVATGLAGARGILVKGGDVLERAAGATDVLLDKTGTVTRGRPALSVVIPLAPGLTRDAALALAAAAERRSEHHVGRAVVEAARGLRLEPEASAFQAIPGRGVVATVDGAEVLVGNRALLADRGVALPDGAAARAAALEARGETAAFLARIPAGARRSTGSGRADQGSELLAVLGVADPVRVEAAGAVAALRKLGLRVAIVSGDARRTTEAVAGGLGIDALAECLPEGKRAEVARLQAAGRRVLFAGDGMNDAPALTQADVGTAMGRGTDVTLESADGVLVRDDLALLPDLVRLSRKAYAVIRQNVFWAFFYNAVAIPLAMAGVLHPIVAAAAMAASSLFVVGNSARLRRALG